MRTNVEFSASLIATDCGRDTLPDESDWEALRQYDFIETIFLDVPSFMEKTDFWAKAMWVVKSKIDVEREKKTPKTIGGCCTICDWGYIQSVY